MNHDPWIGQTQAWLRRYDRSPHRVLNVARQLGRRVLGLHCLEWQEPIPGAPWPGRNWSRCRKCGAWIAFRVDAPHGRILWHWEDQGCPLVNRLIDLVQRPPQDA